MASLTHNIDCKVTFTAWYYVAMCYRSMGVKYPEWLKQKTVAWMVCGELVRQVKLIECL